MEQVRKYIKTDRNGTRYFDVKDICPRCGGRGDYILGTINYGVCFLCGGTGAKHYTVKEYTPEHEAKLEAQRKARAQKRAEEAARYAEEHADEIIESRYAEFGCGADGIGFVLSGNTYPVKNEIRRNGGKWIYGRWICPVEVKGAGITAKRIDLNGRIGSGSEVWLNGFTLWDTIEG